MKLFSILTILGITSATTWADEKPPADALPLSKVIEMIENKGYTPVVEVNFDDGKWEIEAYKDANKRELHVNAKSGEIEADKAED
ncbi:PepSY domain-containing protein [Rubritalea spongiae]|uniref:PepSY domain-containing protein n=1 Tax=Rubritalea spongiae TaxID=430797 RepID=A0ABW5E415_9BACT